MREVDGLLHWLRSTMAEGQQYLRRTGGIREPTARDKNGCTMLATFYALYALKVSGNYKFLGVATRRAVSIATRRAVIRIGTGLRD